MKETKFLKGRMSDGKICSFEVEISTVPPWLIEFEDSEGILHVADDGDLFEDLKTMRKILEAQGFQLLCNGARKDVMASGMSRSMGGGRRAYRIFYGQEASLKDLLDIFDDTEDQAFIGTVEEQTEYFKAWYSSVQNARKRKL